MIEVERDYAGIRIAAREWFEEGHKWPRLQRTLLTRGKSLENRDSYIRDNLPELTVAAGYYSWVSYLAWLDRIHEVVRFVDLTAHEAEGLLIVRDIRSEFVATHPRCPKCGALNDKGAIGCGDCGVRFGE